MGHLKNKKALVTGGGQELGEAIVREETIRSFPLRRAGTPDDVARAVLFLLSEFDGFITGATLDINGGAYMV